MKRQQKNAAITEEKVKQYVRQIKYTNQGRLRTEVTPEMDFKDEPVYQYDVPDVENTLVDDCK